MTDMEMTPALREVDAGRRKTAELVSWAERIIRQSQYEVLTALDARPLADTARGISAGDVVCLFRVTELVFSRQEGSHDRLSTVLNSLHACGASCLMLLECQNGRAELYLGAVNKRRYDNVYFLNTIREALRTGLEGNLPGTELTELVGRQEIQDKLDECLDNGFDSQCITAVSCVPSEPKDGEPAAHGIERLLEAIGSRNFSIMVLADPVDAESMQTVRQGYESLATQLSALEEQSVSTQKGLSATESVSTSESVSDSWSRNISMTQSHTTGTGWSSGKDDRATKIKRLASAGATVFGGYLAMTAVSTALGVVQQTESSHTDESVSGSEGLTSGRQTSRQEGTGHSVATSESTTLGCTATDYHAKNLRERVTWYLQWLNRRENLGMFNSCAYIISSSAGLNLMVASQYQALMQGEGEMNQPVTLNTWTEDTGVDAVRTALRHLTHPAFGYAGMDENFTPAVLMSSKELSRQMALPQRSVVGLTVMEYASFGREVVRKVALRSGRVLRIGCISHMGKSSPDQGVLLDIQSLAAHTFVAGTNGSGKSNTIFRMLEGLQDAGIPFLVIEPAKGEYKNIFGRDDDVHVYGTNPDRTDLLRINPFWFNDDVNVLEHIDKLLSVFNASWSMYAAMPAVLKASLEGAYRDCGWDLRRSRCRGGVRVFPTVRDVLDQFNGKMASTAFSEEVKGNYVGALSTRMESLCNGIYGEIFGGSNLSDEALFDSSVIIDLSRVGSAETKSMLMGVLLIRLQEYRMRFEAMNLPLKHVTVLEEAHHLLRRTSDVQSDEGSNMLGKSVEMISTAIAEMRSYGEGFMIVDQSPGLLDMSVMRNTNTKIILRLPESGDRELVGNTMGLTPEQIYEMSRFRTGVAAVYQQNWLEAVLCQVDRARHEAEIYRKAADDHEETARRARIVRALLGKPDSGAELLEDAIAACGQSGAVKRRLLACLGGASGADRAETRALISAVVGEDLTPEPWRGEAEARSWLRDVTEDPDLLAQWGADAWPEAVRACIQSRAAEDEAWQALPQWLPELRRTASDGLRAARGAALRRTCPLLPAKAPEDTPELRAAVSLLRDGELEDKTLSDLLEQALNGGTQRQRGVIQPWADVVWAMIGGQPLWDRLFSLIGAQDTAGWDAQARQAVREAMDADADTETSVLSLYLQKKGAVPEVRQFYPLWMRAAQRRKQAAKDDPEA